MPGSDITVASCPFCEWKNRTHCLPNHLVGHHSDKINLSQLHYDHCLRGFVRHKKEEIDFAVCLTCKKGTTAELYCGNGARWLRLHSKKTDCKAAHAAAMTAFKALQESVTPAAAPTPAVSPVTNSLDSVWMRMKEDVRTRSALLDVETRFRATFDDDSDNEGETFTLDMAEGFKQLARDAIGFKREMERQKAIVSDHESRLQQLETEMKLVRAEKEAVLRQNHSILAELKARREADVEKHATE